MKNKRTSGFVSLALLIASLTVLGTPDKSHASALDGERSYFSEYGVEYGGYIYAALNRQLVKIPPCKDKINENAEFVMDCPGGKENYYGDGNDITFIKNGGNLYINFSAYMFHGGLFRVTPGSYEPEFVVKTDTDAGGLSMSDSNRFPETLKFLSFSEGGAGTTFGDLYGYFPYKNKAVKLKSYRTQMKIDDFIGITKDDAVLVSQFVYGSHDETTRLEGVNRITIDPETGEVKTERLLDVKDMPKTYLITPSPDMEKLYLFGAGLSVYDVKSGSLNKIVEFKEIIKNWPDDAYPYLTDASSQSLDEYYGYEEGEDIFIFVIDEDR
ncbi:MAG: hypothetical protein LBL05_06225, partial [Synergistaceae bacterium]|nr:hypothetical protein [Synergistaceae bacterium]